MQLRITRLRKYPIDPKAYLGRCMLIVPLKNGRFLLQIQHEYPWIKLNMNQDTQCRAVRYIFNDFNFTSSVSSMLNQLALPTLEKRRKIASLSMFYKINHGLVRIKFPDYIKPTLRNRFSIPYSRIDAPRHSFFPRTAKLWNYLPPDMINCPALETFRAGIDQYLH